MIRPKIKIIPGANDHYEQNMSFIKIESTTTPVVNASISNFEDLTKLQQSKIAWIWSLIGEGKPNFKIADKNEQAGEGYKGGKGFHLPRIYSGNAMGWLEPFVDDEDGSPTNKISNGVFASLLEKPYVYGYEWREYSQSNNGNKIDRVVKYGETIQLHVYTKGLYGDEILIGLLDTKGINEDLPIHKKENQQYQELPKPTEPISKVNNYPKFHKSIEREVGVFEHLESTSINANVCEFFDNERSSSKKVQKCIVNVYIDPIWSFYVNTESGKSDNDVILMANIFALNNTQFILKSKDAPEITISGKTKVPSFLEPVGNNPVLAGVIETNVADFFDCRFDKITLKQQLDTKVVDVFLSLRSADRKKDLVEIDVIVGPREKFLLDFDLKTEECEAKPTKHFNKELSVSSVPANFELKIENGNGSLHDSKVKEKSNSDVSSKTSIMGVSSSFKDEHKAERGIVTVYQKQIEFDGFYNYDIPSNTEASPVKIFAKALQYFWLPDLGNKISSINAKVVSCAFQKNIKISLYPDIKWTLKFGFNVTEDHIEALNKRGSRTPFGIFEAVEGAKTSSQKAADKKEQKYLNNNKEIRKIRNEQIDETRKEFKLKKKLKKKKTANTPKTKGKISGLIKILKQLNISLQEEHYGGDQRNELSEEFVKQFYNRFAATFELVLQVAEIINGDKDPSEEKIENLLQSKGKSVAGLREKMKRKPTEYEIDYPKIALAGSWFYEKIDEIMYPNLAGRQGLALDINFSAKPLIGLTIKWDLLELLCRKHPIAYAVLKALDALIYIIGDDESAITCEASIGGSIAAEVDFQHNMLAGFKNLAAKGKSAINVKLEFSINIAQTSKILNYEVIVKRGFSVGASSGIGITDVYGINTEGFYMQKILEFEGIKFEFSATGIVELKRKEGNKKNSLLKIGGEIKGEITFLDYKYETPKIYFK